jgi:UDP-N-acetylglucosamine 3-dehydrogenase
VAGGTAEQLGAWTGARGLIDAGIVTSLLLPADLPYREAVRLAGGGLGGAVTQIFGPILSGLSAPSGFGVAYVAGTTALAAGPWLDGRLRPGGPRRAPAGCAARAPNLRRGGGGAMLSVAVIGCGGIGNTHARHYAADGLCRLVAVCDIVRERADATARRFGVKAYYDVAEMLAAEQIDAVSVCTAGADNGGDHYLPARQCLEAGKHVLVEKPITNDLQQAKELVALARARGLHLAVDLNHRYVPMAEKAKQWVEEGRLGELLLCNMTLWIANPNESSPWFHLRALHSHSIDVMRYFCGDIRRVHAFLTRSSRRRIWSNCVISVEFENGCIGALFGSYEAAPRHGIERCEVLGTAGRFVLDNVLEELQFFPHGSDEILRYRETMMGPGAHTFDDTFRNRIHRWLEEVTRGGPISGSGEDGLQALAVIEAAIRSFQEGRPVAVAELLG